MYRVWYSTESFADYIVDNTDLRNETIVKNKMYESDANNPRQFHTTPDHIRKILYLDAPDLIVEKDNEPVFCIEVSTEAGTGHNAFQRFARIAAAVENNVPAFYIYPEGVIISRNGANDRWDKLNPLIFQALESVMSIYNIPALLYYFPSDIKSFPDNPQQSPNYFKKGLRYDFSIDYAGCPDHTSNSMQNMFMAINEIISKTNSLGVVPSRAQLLQNLVIRQQRTKMQAEYYAKSNGETTSPLSAVTVIPTAYLLNYLSKYEDNDYKIGELLRGREKTAIYQVNAKFRGDPYPGSLAAIDYLKCREGRTFEDRKLNLVMLWGKLIVDDVNKTIRIDNQKNSTINDFFENVKSCNSKNLLLKNYSELKSDEIPRYLMQVRYGSTFSKVKHIRVYSYFADAILFPDGSLWRDA